MKFSDSDLKQIQSKGIETSMVERQLEQFKKGFRPVDLAGPATVGNGINVFDDDTITRLLDDYDKKSGGLDIVKFVPASGAASRMFKSLMSFYNDLVAGKDPSELLQQDQSFNSAFTFFTRLKDFAFYEDLEKSMKAKDKDIENCLNSGDFKTVLENFLFSDGLDYISLPKALLKFHAYVDSNRTSLEEHLTEAALYATSAGGKSKIHFTLSPEHIEKVELLLKEVLPLYEKEYGVRFEISYSIQDPSTDTIAVNPDNTPFREPDGSMLFRPGGHGALINNLQQIKADIIFIKNIDNIVPDKLKAPTVEYKKLIGSYLLYLRDKIFGFLNRLDQDKASDDLLNAIEKFYAEELMVQFPAHYRKLNREQKTDWLWQYLNRPVRVCGMVKNEGEPGGGPFLVRQKDGSVTPQIVEGSQIDMTDRLQVDILKSATHFNPVDLVVSTKNYKGDYFNLSDFIDPETGFISEKSKDAKSLKALELPGLWNGAMAFWNTAFVEVPLITFNPVKYINDLLREQHQ